MASQETGDAQEAAAHTSIGPGVWAAGRCRWLRTLRLLPAEVSPLPARLQSAESDIEPRYHGAQDAHRRPRVRRGFAGGRAGGPGEDDPLDPRMEMCHRGVTA